MLSASGFAAVMNQHVKIIEDPITTLDVWSHVRNFVDIGGGNGFIASKIVEKHPHIVG